MILPCLVRAAPLWIGVLAGGLLFACRTAPVASRPPTDAAESLDAGTEKVLGTAKYYVVGQVEDPGARDFTGDLTLFEAVMAATPESDSGNLGRVRLIRADPRDPFVRYFDLRKMTERGDSTSNVHVEAGDVVEVPALEETGTSTPR
jgi:hypothetical protein